MNNNSIMHETPSHPNRTKEQERSELHRSVWQIAKALSLSFDEFTFTIK